MLALHLGCLLLAANASQPSKADQALFTWFDKLGHTQALKNELVVVMGSQGYGGIWAMDRPGFVVNESPGRMRILTAAMESVPWIVGNDVVLNASAQRDVDLRAVVQERLKSNESDHYRYNDTSGVLDYFLFGRACYLRGFRTEGSKILGLAHKNAAKRHLDFADAIKKWCDDGEFQQTRSAIATPRAPLSSFIGAYLTYLRRFPKGRHVTEVTHDLSILDWMVDEEKKHPDWLTKPIGQFKPDQQAAKLVYRLRRMDGSGSELYQPSKLAGGYDVEGVLNEGMNGVPALLAALDDPSFSRRYNGINKSPYVMGELAAIVLEQLSGEELTYYPWELPDDDKRASMRARIAKWQRSLQPPKSPTDHPIVDLAGEGELSKEIRSGKTLASRMNAALQFALIDRRKAADSVRPQWKYLNTEAEGTDGLIRFMAKYAGADGIQELAGDFRSLVSSDRSTILHELAAPGPEPVPQYSKGELAALVKSRRQLLVEGLGDDQVVPWKHGIFAYARIRDKLFEDLRVYGHTLALPKSKSMDAIEEAESAVTDAWLDKASQPIVDFVYRSDVDPLEVRLYADRPGLISAEARDKLFAINWKKIDTDWVVSFLKELRSNPVPGATTCVVWLTREDGGAGVRLGVAGLGDATTAGPTLRYSVGAQGGLLPGGEGASYDDPASIRGLIDRALHSSEKGSIGIWIEVSVNVPEAG